MQVTHEVRSVRHPADLATAWKAREYAHTSHANVTLDIGSVMKIRVKTCTKASKEPFPKLGKETPFRAAGPHAAAAGVKKDEEERGEGEGEMPYGASFGGPRGGLVTDREYFRVDDVDKACPVPAEDRVRGYRVSQGKGVGGWVDLPGRCWAKPVYVCVHASRFDTRTAMA